MYQALNSRRDVLLIDTMTGTILDAAKVVAVPADVVEENDLDNASDSTICGFGERYGFPIYIFVMGGQ